MIDAATFEALREGILVALKVVVPMLVISMAVGVLISILQAATQIHEQTITFVPKLLLVAVILLAGGGWMLATLQDYALKLFALMAGPAG